ncbi:Protein png1 [Fusarium poae]
MTSIFDAVKWKGCLAKYTSPYSLYRYKECPTPENFAGQQKVQAFELDYDRHSKSTSLQHDQGFRDGIAVEFSNTGTLPQVSTIDKMIGWYFDEQGLADFLWRDLKPGMEEEAQSELDKKKKFDWIRKNEGHLYGINRLWAIRGYFIGPDNNNAPPCITVLCANEDVARFLVDRIHSKLHLHKGWGATRLPGVKVLKFGSNAGSDDDSDKVDDGDKPQGATAGSETENTIQVDTRSQDNQSMPTMTNGDLSSWALQRHRCGIQVEIVKESEVISRATIGGLIIVGDEVYGLTVGHLFSPLATHEEEQQSTPTDTVATMITWQESEACGMEFDWALVKIPGLQKQDVESWMDVNLVRTVSGEFRPVLIAFEEPSPYTHVVIATPGTTRCLRGVFIGSASIVNIPESPYPYATWICRMELQWLIQPGDSGSWVLDATNGILLGVLVAGCPELQEAYIIPAHKIFDDIERHYTHNPDLPVHLPNCHSLPRTNQMDLHSLIKEFGSIVKIFELSDSPEMPADFGSRIEKWIEKADAFTDISPFSYSLRAENSQWSFATSVRQYQDVTPDAPDMEFERFSRHPRLGYDIFEDDPRLRYGRFEDELKTAIQQPPLRCYNFMNEKFVPDLENLEFVMLLSLRRCLMLGLSEYSRYDTNIPNATNPLHSMAIEREAILMNHKTSANYSGLPSPWDNRSVKMRHGKHRSFFPWYGHACRHKFPGGWLNQYRYWDPKNGDYPDEVHMFTPSPPPWDRLTATGVLKRLRHGLLVLDGIQRKGIEISLRETEMSDLSCFSPRLETESGMVLFAVKVVKKEHRFLAILPPPSIGPSTCTHYGIPGNDYPEYYASSNAIAYSCWRLPYLLTDKSVPDEENLKRLLSEQFDIDISAFKQPRKLNLHAAHSGFYLKEYNRYVDVVIYEGHIDDQSPGWKKHRPTGWIMPTVNQEAARKHLSPPFSAILDFDDVDMEF